MAKQLGVFAFVALVVTFGSTFVAIACSSPTAGQFLELTKALLSWQVIAGGLLFGAGRAFKGEIATRLKGAAGGPGSAQ